ncbi:beta-ketoacyl synthase N-terminal-like domain-containing protein [Zobellia galactanivorans]|uniref:3-oxoacyl-[acyl-carrier-protein] synthase n=1 Tax=Zobellia galactanivorans (strain DSM 12802 / CCUG 47099 / CIP 106680 / NCIMB 13871 / Dsij) TaxID=63186 RepID=G0LBJ1_ZOBGA|nr:beta-ketoacyl synthase N-terminal-like domain-containing protein [Zobellia galactanivorans]CAZ96215.1 3-oxoacyl-[acyl-carrier-protein] synthase [Zobellia galactanivorans]
MDSVYLSHNNIVSAYGLDSPAAINGIKNEVSGLTLVNDPDVLPNPFYSSLIDQKSVHEAFSKLNPQEAYTRLEQILLVSLADTLKKSGIPLTDRVGLIISTTKGNIDVLDADSPFDENRAYLSELGEKIKSFFGFKNEALVVSNACVSGVLALAVAKRLIHQKRYDHVFVVAGDLVSKFILSGFNSFQALSESPCRPYCKTRAGINIGEVGCSILVTKDKDRLIDASVRILGEASCNDANHISGPSRTGEGLYRSITSAMDQAQLAPKAIDFISAHGTATMYNDEMEAIAFNRAHIQDSPLNSLKGYFGHTLGASGLLETIIGMYSLHSNTLFASLGFQELGVSQPLNIIQETSAKESSVFLKTASGFGGCNTAAIFQKVNP